MAKVRWFSETKVVELPEERVQVTYNYTNPYHLTDVQEIISESLTDFGQWGDEYFTVWLCQNDDEWKEAHARLLSTVQKDSRGTVALKERPIARLAYAPQELQKIFRRREGRLFDPNLILNNREFNKLGKEVKRYKIKHEISHRIQTDCGYSTPILMACEAIHYKYPTYKEPHSTIFLKFKGFTIDISANEICIDFGFKDDVFVGLKDKVDQLKLRQYEKEKDPMHMTIPILGLSTCPLPFKHRNEEGYATRMRRYVDDYLKQVKVMDAVSLRKDFEGILDRVRNPPEQLEVEIAYDEVMQRLSNL